MKKLIKIVSSILLIITLALLGAYFYFEQKFTPEKNYLTLKGESGKIPITWLGTNKNTLLLPVHFPRDTTKYYMQFDTGSPYTLFYAHSIKQLKEITFYNERSKTSFYLGNTKITSDRFKIINNEKESNKNHSIQIIGTLGADLLEDKKTLINLKKNHIIFNLLKEPAEFKNKLIDFTFKKRKIIIQGVLKGKEEKFLYDSGTSAYELLTNKEVWNDLKLPKSKVTIEKAQSWQNILTVYTAKCNNTIEINDKEILLHEVTYVEGFSQTQYFLMKFSGMTGMLGNKIFLKNHIYLDCSKNKIGIE